MSKAPIFLHKNNNRFTVILDQTCISPRPS